MPNLIITFSTCKVRRLNRALAVLTKFRFMSVLIVTTKCKMNNAELFLELFYIQRKEIGNKNYYLYEETRGLENGKLRFNFTRILTLERRRIACVADETKPRYSPSANQRLKACSAPRVLPGFSIIGSNWLMHLAVLSCTVIGRVDLVEPWLRSR